ncbi:GGDEF domain-containing protein [Aureimonas populi]|uniref:diguanylate cyclase n=1 Tax=Aureimonas populi TaxID=1701758 RepID=A0ABW5CPQ0_9HYPH|nr:GGDEF domain-containing protein [Aureimonas populi]
MEHPLRTLAHLCLEIAGLAVLASLATLVAAFHVFNGFTSIDAQTAILFCVGAVFLSLVALVAYAAIRIARLKAENRLLQRAATRDGLTRLLNRAAFQGRARDMIAAIGRRSSDAQALTLLIVDADHFKRINDRLGHGVGDKALLTIATTLAGSLRRDDLVGRIGGEEFAVLLKGAGPEEAKIVAERLRSTVHRLAVGPREAPARLSISIGGVSFDRPVPFDMAYRQADALLYKAKRGGRNRFEIAPFALPAPARTRRRLTGTVNAQAMPKARI